MIEFKFYQGISEENFRKAYDEIKAKGNEIINTHFLEMSDTFIISFNPRDKTTPPKADLEKDIHSDVLPLESHNIESSIFPKMENTGGILKWLKKHWYVSLPVVGAIGFYFLY